MDPLSVIASITGILAAAAKITTVVTGFIEKNRDVPNSTRSVLTEVSDLSLCLAQLAPFIRGTRIAERTRKDAISVEQIVVVSTSLVLNISELEQMLDSLSLDQPMSMTARMRWVKVEGRIECILTRIRASKSSLNLILTIFTCASTEAAQSSIWNLTTAVDRILQTSEDVSRRMASLETCLAASTRYATSRLRVPLESDNVSTIDPEANDSRGRDLHAQTSEEQSLLSEWTQQILQFDPSLESELYASRVYSRTTERHSISSLFSREDSVCGLSFLSGISLAQISNLSVLSLPIFCHELWNSGQYRSSEDLSVSVEIDAAKAPILDIENESEIFDVISTESGPEFIVGLNENPIKRMPKIRQRAKSSVEASHFGRFYRMSKEQNDWGEAQIKILLLGAGESGKSTVLKQMRLLFADGFRLKEREWVQRIIFNNILVAFAIIFIEMRDLGIGYELETSLKHEHLLLDFYNDTDNTDTRLEDQLPRIPLTVMKEVYADKGFQKAIKRGGEYALHDNFQYYLENIERLCSPDYLPSDKDVLQSRIRTSGVTETIFDFGNDDYHIFDVGGARFERKKWFDVVEDVHCLVFVAPLSGYDECLVEDKTANQMRESLLLFESIMSLSLSWFTSSSIILLMTKLDLFKAKIQSKPIQQYFPDYKGRSNDSDAAQTFFVDKFLSLNRTSNRRIDVYCADVTDTIGFKPVLQTIMEIAKENAKSWGKGGNATSETPPQSVVTVPRYGRITSPKSIGGKSIGKPVFQGSSHPITNNVF